MTMSLIESLVEVTLKAEDDFLKVRETLTRIGVASRKEKTLFQSCHRQRAQKYNCQFTPRVGVG
jgi:hypothetical protein